MSLQLFDEITMAQQPGSTAMLNKERSFSVGKKCRALLAVAICSITNTNVAAKFVTQADALDALGFIFSQWLMQFGIGDDLDVADPSMTFLQMRVLNAILRGEDFQVFNQVTGEWVAIASLNPTDHVSGSIASAGTTTLKVMFIRPFTVLDFFERQHDFAPGKTQMEQMYVEVTSGSSFQPTNGNFALNANIAIRITVEQLDDSEDPWSIVPRMSRNTTPGLNLRLPGGILLALYDFSFVATSTPLTTYQILRNDDQPLIPSILYSDYFATILGNNITTGTVPDINLLATQLFRITTPGDLKDAPCASGYTFFQPANDLATPILGAIYIPSVGQARLNLIGKNVTSEQAPASVPEALLTRPQAANHPELPGSVVSCLPVAIVKGNDHRYETQAGTRFTRGSSTGTTVVPKRIVNRASKASPADKIAAARKVAKAIPGATTGNRNASVPGAAPIVMHLFKGV